MPPRTRTRATKVLKENIEIVKKDKLKSNGKVTKPTRKALADKTNSLSDDNASITDIPIKTSTTSLKNNADITKTDNNVRPRRDRRLPPRYVENHVLQNRSNNKDLAPSEAIDSIKISTKASLRSKKRSSELAKETTNGTKYFGIPSSTEGITTATYNTQKCHGLQSKKSVFKDSAHNVSSTKDLDCSLVANRPKRICRLPSKFEDHSISPNKFIPVQPCHASTPIIQKNVKTARKKGVNVNVVEKKKIFGKDKKGKSKRTKAVAQSNSSSSSVGNISLDTNNNGKNKLGRAKRATVNIVKKLEPKSTVNTKVRTKQASPKTKKMVPFAKRLLEKSLPFRILDDQKQPRSKNGSFDVYEFTFDPNEEPPPQKKKRKRTVKKKPAKPKMVVLKSNYNDNVSKALTNLKSKIKPSQSQPVQNIVKPTDTVKSTNSVKLTPVAENVQSTQVVAKAVVRDNIPQMNNDSVEASAMPPINESWKTPIHKSNYASIRIEDIAADFESNDHNDINYSPVKSPQAPLNTEAPETNQDHINPVLNTDPLNLQGDISFFGEHPVASSSMNVSAQHPLASPWRVEFRNLPVKWHSNAYVKPNMTPAVESSFINSEDTAKKKHVYTNMVSENEPEIVEAPNLKQTSIISFMREVAEKSLNNKKRRRPPSPTKQNSIFEDVTNTLNDIGYKTPKKVKKTSKDSTPNISKNSNDQSNDKENSTQSSNQSISPAKPQKKKDKDCTYFGFDDSENLHQENNLPVINIPNSRGLRSRTVLQDLNAQVGPTRAVMPVAKAKPTSSEVVGQLCDQLKSADDAQFLVKETAKESVDGTVASDISDPSWHEEEDDSQSVHLFEDIEVVHHMKGYRKSYGKAKKVTIRQPSDSDSDTQPRLISEPVYTADEDLADPSFYLPNIKEKKATKQKKPKKQLTKKEEKEVEEWAAGFNSMCEDIDEFPLLVE